MSPKNPDRSSLSYPRKGLFYWILTHGAAQANYESATHLLLEEAQVTDYLTVESSQPCGVKAFRRTVPVLLPQARSSRTLFNLALP